MINDDLDDIYFCSMNKVLYCVISFGVLGAHAASLSPVLPKDLSESTQAAADQFSWQSFVALSWPAKMGERGQADTTKKPGDAGPIVWETFKVTEEVFLPNAQDPGPWSSPNLKLASTKRLASTSKISRLLRVNKAALTGFAPQGKDQAVGGSLTDQNGNLTYYERAVNEVAYEYIRTNRFYNTDILAKAGTVNYSDWSMTLKASWKILIEGKDEASNFHSRKAEIDGETVTVGLVGLHIVTKTPSSPQWIWSTFEHVGNAPTFSGKRIGKYSYYDPDCPVSTCPPNTSTENNGKPTGKPTQVLRETEIYQSARDANRAWRKQLKGTVWENYELVGTQWPTLPKNPGVPTGRPQPTLLANSTMETYIQTTSSCIQCHSTSASPANPSERYDFTFLLFGATKPTGN